ncbi:MAG: polysaccharide pyruvyl transferase family protein [Gammaproteobacteria bacterium]|nr:polysaccharide pyruvyl transferase family protein [Gammaproteobacteria bacterium]
MRPVIAVFGEWSQTNIGDHAIHEGVQAFFHECGWQVRSFELGALRPASCASAGVAEVAQLRELRWRATSVLNSLPAAKRSLRGIRQRLLMRRLLPLLTDCDAICVGGGALLTDINLHFMQSLAVLTHAARRLRKPLLCLGCSADGQWSARGREIVRDFLATSCYVAVRDHATAERVVPLLDRCVPIFGDFALSTNRLHADDGPQRVTARYLLAVNVSQVATPYTSSQSRYEDGLVEIVRQVLARNADVRPIAIFTTGTAQDLAPATRVYQRLLSAGVELHAGRDLAQVRQLLGASRAVLASRLHAAILSLAQHTPVIGYSATPKLGNFFDSLGLDDDSFGPNDEPPRVVQRLFSVMSRPVSFSPSACAAMVAARQLARHYLSSLAAVRPIAEVVHS